MYMRSPWSPNRTSSSVGSGPALPNQCGVRVSNSATATGGEGNGSLERVTVNLTERAAQALRLAAELNSDSKTDTINRALQMYAFMKQVQAQGGAVYVRQRPDSELKQLDETI